MPSELSTRITLAINQDLSSNVALNLLLPKLIETHQLTTFYSNQVGKQPAPPLELVSNAGCPAAKHRIPNFKEGLPRNRFGFSGIFNRVMLKKRQQSNGMPAKITATPAAWASASAATQPPTPTTRTAITTPQRKENASPFLRGTYLNEKLRFSQFFKNNWLVSSKMLA